MDTTRTARRSGLMTFSTIAFVLGILGFIPGITHDNHLFWIVQVGPVFNTMYIVAGLIGFVALASSEAVASGVAKVFAVLFALWAVIGLFTGDNLVLGFIENNYWSVILNAIMAVGAASIGWSTDMASMPAKRDAVAFGEYRRDHLDE